MAFNSRGLQIGVIVTVCVIIVGCCIAWFVVVPMVIDQKVSAALAKASEKTGRHFEVSDIRLSGLSSARISRITISDVDVPDRPGLTVEDLKVSLSGMPIGDFSIAEVKVGELGINLRVDGAKTNFDDILEKLKPKEKTPGGAKAPSAWKKLITPFPVIEVSEVSVSMPPQKLRDDLELGAVSASGVSLRASEDVAGQYDVAGDVSALIVSAGEHQTYESHLSGSISSGSKGVISLSQPRGDNGSTPSVFKQHGASLSFDHMNFVFPATVEIVGLEVLAGEKQLFSADKVRAWFLEMPPRKVSGIYFKEVELVSPVIHDYFLDDGSLLLGLVSKFADLPEKLKGKAAQVAQDATAVALEAGIKAAMENNPNPGEAIARAVVADAVKKTEKAKIDLKDYFFTQRLFVTDGKFVLDDLRNTSFLNAEVDDFDLEIGYRNIRRQLDVDISMAWHEPIRSEVTLGATYHMADETLNGSFVISSLKAGSKLSKGQVGLEQYHVAHPEEGGALYKWLPKMDLKDTQVAAKIEFDADMQRSLITLGTQFKVDQFAWQIEALSREPTVLSGSLSAVFKADLNAQTFNVEDVSLETSGASLRFGAKIANVPRKARKGVAPGETWQFDITTDLPNQNMQVLFDAIPHALRTELDGLTWRGTLGLHFEAHGTLDALSDTQHKFSLVPSQDFQILKWPAGRDLNALNHGMHYEVQDPNALQPHTITIPPSIYPVMIQGITTYMPRMTAEEVRQSYPDWVLFDDINPWLIQLITTTEDGSFFTHQGFSPLQVKAALEKNVNRQAFSRGASTISMQLVKNLFFDRTKTISRKFQEVIYTWLMESVMRIPKKRIMELYFNIIEFGPEIYGIEEAAKYYFGKRSRALSLKECAFLMAIIPSPRRGAYYRTSPKLENGIQKTMSFYIREMYRRKCDPDVLARMRARAAKLNQPVTFEPCCPPRDSLQLMLDSDTLAFYVPDPNNPAVYGYNPELYTELGEPLVPLRAPNCGYRGDGADAETTESIFETFLPETMPSKELNN